jgi:hypothetical protein
VYRSKFIHGKSKIKKLKRYHPSAVTLMSKTRRSARNLPAKNLVDPEFEEPSQQEQPSTVAEDVSQNEEPTIKIKLTLPVPSKKGRRSGGTVQQSEPPLNGHSQSPELARERHHSGM